MKRGVIFSAALILMVLVGIIAAISYTSLSKKSGSHPFYIGVTYGGDNSAEAKLLIDRVKNYTNLFVVQSGPLQCNISELENICDYAVKSGLDIIIYFGSFESQRNITAAFTETAQQRWGTHFLGLYYGDEPGGKRLMVLGV